MSLHKIIISSLSILILFSPLAYAKVVFNDVSPITAITVNPCNSELVIITGETRTLITTTNDAKGGQHYNSHIIATLSGEGLTTGSHYQILSINNTGENFAVSSGTLVSNTSIVAEVIASGDVPNFKLKGNIHFTINANGQTSVSFSDVSSTCQ